MAITLCILASTKQREVYSSSANLTWGLLPFLTLIAESSLLAWGLLPCKPNRWTALGSIWRQLSLFSYRTLSEESCNLFFSSCLLLFHAWPFFSSSCIQPHIWKKLPDTHNIQHLHKNKTEGQMLKGGGCIQNELSIFYIVIKAIKVLLNLTPTFHIISSSFRVRKNFEPLLTEGQETASSQGHKYLIAINMVSLLSVFSWSV